MLPELRLKMLPFSLCFVYCPCSQFKVCRSILISLYIIPLITLNKSITPLPPQKKKRTIVYFFKYWREGGWLFSTKTLYPPPSAWTFLERHLTPGYQSFVKRELSSIPNISLEPDDSKDIGIGKFEFVARTQFLSIHKSEPFARNEMSSCHKLGFSIPNIFTTRCGRPLIFQSMNSV